MFLDCGSLLPPFIGQQGWPEEKKRQQAAAVQFQVQVHRSPLDVCLHVHPLHRLALEDEAA